MALRLRPPGIEAKVFDGSDQAYEDWNTVYNRAFEHHYHGVKSTVEDCRWLLSRKDVDPTSLLLAYRGHQCVGFCRNDLQATRGEIAVLGVDPNARGIGLGRTLLRWGIAWLEGVRVDRVTLMVDGENETALKLYRSEGFETVRTREIWSRTSG
jgi:mycothiol synthase